MMTRWDERGVNHRHPSGRTIEAFDGKLMMVLHQPFRQARGKLFEMEDTGDTVRVKRQIVN
jgi:hypothetical protein